MEHILKKKNSSGPDKPLAGKIDEIKIIRYDRRYKKFFRQLNLEWIQKYFEIEPEDKLLLDNPDELIIDRGGDIFFAQVDNRIVGTVAMIRHDEKTFELAKMGITEQYRGRHISNDLMEAAIKFGKDRKARAIILDTNSSLKPAIALYIKYGFKPYKKMEEEKYERADVHLKLILR